MSTWLAGRKTFTPISTSRPPLIFLVTRPCDHVALVVLGDHRSPRRRIRCGLLARENDLAGVVLHPFEQNLDLVARLRGRFVVVPLVERYEPFGLVADIDDDLVADHLDDLARDDRADLEALTLDEELVHQVAGVARDQFPEFALVDIEFAKQVAIYHEKGWETTRGHSLASRLRGGPRADEHHGVSEVRRRVETREHSRPSAQGAGPDASNSSYTYRRCLHSPDFAEFRSSLTDPDDPASLPNPEGQDSAPFLS